MGGGSDRFQRLISPVASYLCHTSVQFNIQKKPKGLLKTWQLKLKVVNSSQSVVQLATLFADDDIWEYKDSLFIVQRIRARKIEQLWLVLGATSNQSINQQVSLKNKRNFPRPDLDFLCIQHLGTPSFRENYAKLYFDTKHLEKGLNREW